MSTIEATGGRIRRWRQQRRLSQSELARRSGVSQASVSNLEAGRATLDVSTARRVADALDVPVLVLLEGESALERGGALEPELRWYGLPLGGGTMPWQARPAEEVLAAALRDGAPRVIDHLAALVFLHPRLRPALLVAHAEVYGVRQRLGWLLALARHYAEYEHEGRGEPSSAALRDERLGEWLMTRRSALDWDGFGHSVPEDQRRLLPPFFRRWKVDYDRSPVDLVAMIQQTLERARGRS